MIVHETMNQQKLKALSTVLRFNEGLGNSYILSALYEESKNQWKKFINANNGEHLVKGIHTSGFKSDAVQTYIAVLTRIYLNSLGATVGAWSKETLITENNLTTAVASRIAASLYNDNEALFIDVATRLLGIDRALVEYSIDVHNGVKDTTKLVGCVANFFDDVPADHVALNYEDLIQHLNHIDFAVDRDQLISGAIGELTTLTGEEPNPYRALRNSAVKILGYAIGEESEEDTVFTFPKTTY